MNRDDIPANFLGSFFKYLLTASCDVYFGAILDETRGDSFAETCATAGDKDDLALDVKYILEFELIRSPYTADDFCVPSDVRARIKCVNSISILSNLAFTVVVSSTGL